MNLRLRGLSLSGLLIAVGLGSLLLLAMTSLWLRARIELLRGEEAARMQDTGRHVLALLQREIALAGHAAGLPTQSVAVREVMGIDCGSGADWALVAEPALDVAFSPGAPAITAAGHRLGCIPGVDVQPGSPLLIVRRSSTAPVQAAGAPSGRVPDRRWYLRRWADDARVDWIFLEEGGALPVLDPLSGQAFSYWAWQVSIYYLRRWSQSPGDDIPTLCVERLQLQTMVSECLAEGVEQWVLEFGVDLDGDGVVDRYLAELTGAQLPLLRLVQVHLLLRSVAPVPGIRSVTTFQLGPQRIQRDADGYLRQTVSLTLPLTNLVQQRALEWQP